MDSLRYLGLPDGDHSLEVEGLGRFAPQGSYAHGGQGGLGDEDKVIVAFWTTVCRVGDCRSCVGRLRRVPSSQSSTLRHNGCFVGGTPKLSDTCRCGGICGCWQLCRAYFAGYMALNDERETSAFGNTCALVFSF